MDDETLKSLLADARRAALEECIAIAKEYEPGDDEGAAVARGIGDEIRALLDSVAVKP
jgi:hypothetical protein